MNRARLKAELRARKISLHRHMLRVLGFEFNPNSAAPSCVALSPSERHRGSGVGAEMTLDWERTKITDAKEWQDQVRAKLIELSGYGRFGGPPGVNHLKDCANRDGFRHRSLYLKVRDGLDLPVRMVWDPGFEPDGKIPVMICLQGTNSGMHLSWGEERMPADPIKIYYGADIARQAAARGFLAICLEQSCFGERRERSLFSPSEAVCIDSANHALLLGRSLVGERASDVTSLINWLVEGAPGIAIDLEQIYIVGSSAGGTTALFASAMDERIAGVIASGCIGFIRDTLLTRGDPEGQNVVPGILRWFELDAVVALVAPRPFITVSGDCDHIWPFDGAQKVVESARNIYAAFGADDLLAAIRAEGGHRFYPNLTWSAFANLLIKADHALPKALRSAASV
tara:strand:+ start:4095 stop:5291 length:1197 start_codon:yes stop_codon:yes gene_type:complete